MRLRYSTIVLAVGLLGLAACVGTYSSNGGGTDAPPGQTGGLCAGIHGVKCVSNADFCDMPDGMCVSVPDASGICTPKPDSCTEHEEPVCGCDGVTYGNRCKANKAGTSIAHPGPCDTPIDE